MNFPTGQRTDSVELRNLEGNSGTFFCQHGGKYYLAVCRQGDSLNNIQLRPIGEPIQVSSLNAQSGQRDWHIQRIADTEVQFGAMAGGAGGARQGLG